MVNALERAIRSSWARDSALAGSWREEEPAAGQCAVTALVVQDFLGGTVHRGMVGGTSHYWNVLNDGHIVDLTRSQFTGDAAGGDVMRNRHHILQYADTKRRYELLRSRVLRQLAQNGQKTQAMVRLERAADRV